MATKKRSITLTLLSIMLAFSCVFLAFTLNVNRASATVDDSIYYNYITNGDFETEYDAWGINGTTPERIDDGTGNHVGKMTSAAWVQARVWNAGFMYDNVYKISFKLKLVSADSEATMSEAQYLARLKGNDGAFLAENYVGVGCESKTVALNEWKTYTYYLKVADNRDGTYGVFAGMDYNNLAQVGATTNVELSYLDIAIGCGNFGNLSEWYIDDFTMVNYTEYTKNIVQNGDFETAYEEYGNEQFWAYYGSPERVQLEDGNWVGKVAVTGGFWKAPRIWNASFMYDKTYRISFNIKLVGAEGATTLSGGQFLVNLTSNDDAHIPSGTYIDIGLNDGCAIGDWKNVSYFIRIEKGVEKDVLYTGTTASNLTKKIDCLSTGLSHFNPMIGCGAPGNVVEMYLDDYTIAEYDGDLTVNSDMSEPFAAEGNLTGWGVNSWATTSSERYWDAEKQSYVIKNVGGGWLVNRFWNVAAQNTFEIGKTYRISLEVKGDTDLPNATLQFDGIDANGAVDSVGVSTYQVGGYVSQAVGVYNSVLQYIRFEMEEEKLVMYAGATKAGMAKTTFSTTLDYLTHFDVKLGTGSAGNWYIDNFEVVCVSPDTYTSTITVTDSEGVAINDFAYEITGTYESASISGNVLTIEGVDGEISVVVSKNDYVGATVDVSIGSSTQTIALESAAKAYTAVLTVKETDGTVVADFEYKINGVYESANIEDNVLTVVNALGDLQVVITKAYYNDVTVNVTDTTATQNVTFDKRATVADPTDYSNLLFGFDGFENQPLTETPAPDAIMTSYGVFAFINGGGATVAVSERDSHWGNHSLLVHSVGDRFVTRLDGITKTLAKDTEYHVTYYVKAVSGEITVQPCAYATYWLVGENYQAGANHDTDSSTFNLANAVTVTANQWTKIEVVFSYTIQGDELTFNYGNGGSTTFTATDDIYDVCWLDLSLACQGDYYLDDITFARTYDANATVLDAEGNPVTENVQLTVKDYAGEVLDIVPTVENGKFVFEGLYGTFEIIAEIGGKTYSGTVSINYPELILADEYTATVKVVNGAGEQIANEDVYAIYAQDGASRIDGTYDAENGVYTFGGAMGDLKIFVVAQGFEQHAFYTVTRKNANMTLNIAAIASSLDGLRGNLALQGDVEEVGQLEMYNNTDYAMDGINATGTNNRYSSFGPVLTLSDESAVGEKSVRISTKTEDLRKDDAVYNQFMIDNDLDDAVFGDRVSYRCAGSDYLTDGTTYRFTTYVKAPSTQQGETQFDFIYLMVCNLCNGGQFNIWVPITLEIGSNFWNKVEVFTSYNTAIDEAAEAGDYQYERFELNFSIRILLNGVELVNETGTYGYDNYKDGTYAFYSFNEKGEFYGWGALDTEKHDGGVKDQEGGRSFGSFAYCEPSFQIKNEKSLLIDGTNIVSEYTADIEVLNQDLTPNSQVEYFRLTDTYTGLVSYVEAAQYYDEIDQKYYIPGLYNAYKVTICDANKVAIAGIEEQLISAENGEIIIEYNYDIKLTVKNDKGELVTDVEIRITLANGSVAKAVNNNDGTYTYSGLTGVRNISFRKTGENSYTFPSNLSVSSANNEFEVTVTLKVEENTDPNPNEPTKDKGGCGSFVATSSLFTAVTLLAGSIVVLKKKH